MHRYIAAEEIPFQYGGFKRDNDPHFSTKDGVSEISIKVASYETIEIPAPEVTNFFCVYSIYFLWSKKRANVCMYVDVPIKTTGWEYIGVGRGSVGLGSELQRGICADRRGVVYVNSKEGQEDGLARRITSQYFQEQRGWKGCHHNRQLIL